MIEINLVPDVKQELIRAQRMRVRVITYSIITGIVAVGVVVALSVYVFGVQFGIGAYQDGQITSKYDKLSQTKDLSQILTIQNQLSQVTTLHQASPVTSRIFDMISSISPPASDPNNVTISNLSVDTTAKSIDLQGQTSGYPALETFQKTLKAAELRYTGANGQSQEDPIASGINLSNVAYGKGADGSLKLNFEIQFTYADALFDSTIQNPQTVITGTGNATDSYLNYPKALFAPRGDDNGGTQ